MQGVPGCTLYTALDAKGDPVPGPRVAVLGQVHGNEPVGEVALQRLAREAPAHLIAGSVLAVRANLEAARLGLRHTPTGRDLNRLWDAATLARLASLPTSELCYEESRALEVAPLLLTAQAVLDLHSTSQPTEPFLLFRDDQAHARIAFALGVRQLVTGLHEEAVLSGGLACNVGIRPAERSARLGFTFEAGQHTDPTNAHRAWQVVVRLLHALGLWAQAPEPVDVECEVYDVIERFPQAEAGEEPWRFVGHSGGEPGNGRSGPPRALASFESVEADEVLLRRGRDTVWRAHAPFTVLMPTPTAAPGTDLFFVCQRRHGGLGVHAEPRSDAEARREGLGIERMLDLLDDDDFERGTTRALFDSRRVFDAVADVVLRGLRLPEGHPHRRVTVVGRGDWGGDEAERRASVRYRQAMQTAILEGLPIDRIQLLKGASLSWLEALTSRGMSAHFEARAARLAGRASPLRFFVSARQPSSISLLILGDPTLALRDGDFRHVRVALVVEAAAVGASDAGARVRIVRFGLLSARPEFLKAVSLLVFALKQEHAWLVTQPPFIDDSAIRGVLDHDLGLKASEDAEALAAMQRALRRLQLDLWRAALAGEREAREPIPAESLPRWLADTMARTGIRDEAALRAMLRPLDGARWQFDPGAAGAAPTGPSPRPREELPPQTLRAADITADTLERWAGWKRTLRAGQLIPDTRGKDLDVSFDEADMQRRIARIFDRARQEARRMPGRVLVVVAGDGQSPVRERPAAAAALLRAHREAVLDPRVGWLRIQHAAGTHLSWLRDTLELASQRAARGAPFGLVWEAEHGSSVNVVALCVREADSSETDDRSLHGWSIEQCAVVVSELQGSARDYQLGMFTEVNVGQDGRINQDLVHFVRAHIDGLLAQDHARATHREHAAVEAAVTAQIARWIEAVRGLAAEAPQGLPSDAAERVRWVTEQLGLADHHLARVLALQMDRDTPAHVAAAQVWASVPAWPGQLWGRILAS